MTRTPLSVLLAVAGMAWLGSVGAQALRDPTQPPQLVAPTPVGNASSSVPGEPQLQSVLISSRPGGRKVAVIDGVTVREGDKFRDSMVARITATKVVLKQGKAEQVLVLGPVGTARVEAPKADGTSTESVKTDTAKLPSIKLEQLFDAKARSQ
jgi:MSHA biogenesis protein MshK